MEIGFQSSESAIRWRTANRNRKSRNNSFYFKGKAFSGCQDIPIPTYRSSYWSAQRSIVGGSGLFSASGGSCGPWSDWAAGAWQGPVSPGSAGRPLWRLADRRSLPLARRHLSCEKGGLHRCTRSTVQKMRKGGFPSRPLPHARVSGWIDTGPVITGSARPRKKEDKDQERRKRSGGDGSSEGKGQQHSEWRTALGAPAASLACTGPPSHPPPH